MYFSSLRRIASDLPKRVNLIPYSLDQVFVGHKQLRLPCQQALNVKYTQSPNHQYVGTDRRSASTSQGLL